jgi:hypothetical protein
MSGAAAGATRALPFNGATAIDREARGQRRDEAVETLALFLKALGVLCGVFLEEEVVGGRVAMGG